MHSKVNKTWSVAKHSFPKFNLYNQKSPHSNARKPIKLKWFPQCLEIQHSVSSFISANISVLIEEIYFRVTAHHCPLNGLNSTTTLLFMDNDNKWTFIRGSITYTIYLSDMV